MSNLCYWTIFKTYLDTLYIEVAWIRPAENDNHAWENVNVRLFSLCRPSNLILFKAIRNRSSYLDSHENVSDAMKMQLKTSWGRTRKKGNYWPDLRNPCHWRKMISNLWGDLNRKFCTAILRVIRHNGHNDHRNAAKQEISIIWFPGPFLSNGKKVP